MLWECSPKLVITSNLHVQLSCDVRCKMQGTDSPFTLYKADVIKDLIASNTADQATVASLTIRGTLSSNKINKVGNYPSAEHHKVWSWTWTDAGSVGSHDGLRWLQNIFAATEPEDLREEAAKTATSCHDGRPTTLTLTEVPQRQGFCGTEWRKTRYETKFSRMFRAL